MKKILIIILLLLAVITSCRKTTEIEEGTSLVWREMVYDTLYKDDFSKLQYNLDYFTNVSGAEKAALGYVITFVGNECQWDTNKNNAKREGLKCTLLSALDLGYQGSEKHLSFLRKWFVNDKKALKELAYCPTIPETSTIQNYFSTIKIKTAKNNITVFTEEAYFNVREDFEIKYEKQYHFTLNNNSITLDTIIEKTLK